ncbi:MAG: ribonuclease III [Candidatus Daviesbacteria bacterium]|nr:MAG: ribonuclease III [Candidatus Daviesbacteria bacterium]
MNWSSIKFNNPNLAKEAFTHRSYLNESKEALPSNERLEFLGDAILSFIVSTHIFKLRVSDEEGDLTNLRSYMVKTESLAKAAKNLKLGEKLYLSKGEETSGGRNNTQLLANTYEAYLGALFLDQGIETARKFVEETLFSLFEEELKSGPPKDDKSLLQEVVQTKQKVSPIYKILATTGPDHARKFTVGVFVKEKQLGKGSGSSKQEAEEQAAKEALEKSK